MSHTGYQDGVNACRVISKQRGIDRCDKQAQKGRKKDALYDDWFMCVLNTLLRLG